MSPALGQGFEAALFEPWFRLGFEGACLCQEGLIMLANPALEAMVGVTQGGLAGRACAELFAPEHRGLAAQLLAHPAHEAVELRGLKADGSQLQLRLRSALVEHQGQSMALVLVQNATEQRQSQETLRQHALVDAVTGLPNRALLAEKLGQAMAESQSQGPMVMAAVLDLDRFKMVNESLGRGLADGLLKDVAKRLRRVLRQADCLARLGGDTFGVMLTGLKRVEDAPGAAQKLVEALQAPFSADGRPVHLNASLGYSLSPVHATQAEALLLKAEQALSKAKSSGKNQVQAWVEGMRPGLDRLSLEQELRQAIQDEQFVLYYQPQVEPLSLEIMGLEALVRWKHPEKGLIPPDLFIPLAEETRLILPLGEWLLKEACCQGKAWLDQGFKRVSLSVNLSAQQFQESALPAFIAKTLGESGFPAELLDLEITESMAMQDPAFAMAMLKDLVEMDLTASLDDFGKGYSSLAYLMKFPVKTLKLDQSFIQELGKDTKSTAIVSASIHLAHQLGMQVVAEGVETLDQLAFLRAQGCDRLQGYLFSKALPPSEVAVHLAAGKIKLTS